MAVTPSDEVRQRLASLGYIASDPRPTSIAGPHILPIAKECIGVFTSKPSLSCAQTRQGSWPVPIGQPFVNTRDANLLAASTRRK